MRRLLWCALVVGCFPEPEEPRPSFMVMTELSYENTMGKSFRLRRLAMWIDGQSVATRGGEDLAEQAMLKLGAVTLGGGAHEIAVEAEYQGHGYGVFSYLSGYRFKARTRTTLDLRDPRTRELRCTGYEQGGPTTPLEERPQIRCAALTP